MLHNFVPFYTSSALHQVGDLREREGTDSPADAFEQYGNAGGGTEGTGKKARAIAEYYQTALC